jgi:hypothetical protein
MKRIAVMACTVMGLLVSANTSHASWGAACYSGYQPWWNIFAKRYKCLTPEEERLQKFWHDYYDALKDFYCALDHIDWVAYYKNHGIPVCSGCGPYANCGRVNYYPVFVTPTMQWAVPNGPGCGPGGPGGPPPYGPGPMQGGSGPAGHGMAGPGPMGYPPFPGGYPGAAQGGMPMGVPVGASVMPPQMPVPGMPVGH